MLFIFNKGIYIVHTLYKESEKLLQQVAIKKLNWHHNYSTILTNIIIIIIMSWYILLILGILHNNIDRINPTSTEHWRVISKLWHHTAFC